ncbi:MAG TPA: LacI family DNA-binding transcriptional regulator [Acidimicrobiia bacterium]
MAREAGVHPSTVSRALDPGRQSKVKEATRRRIVDTARRLGYRPHMVARWLQSGRTATVGIVTADLGNTFVTPIIHGIAGAIEGAGMLAMIAETQDDHERFANIMDHMLSRRVDAIVALAARAGDKDVVEATSRVVPVVLAGRPLDDTPIPQVLHDDRRGGAMAAEHLLGLGHRVVAQLRGPDDVANFPRRAEGFSEVCRAAGMVEIPFDERAHRPTIDQGQRLMETLMRHAGEFPTAIFAHNDLIALGALAVIRAAGLEVPGSVSLVGYNDLPMVGLLSPPLTTVRYPSLEVGRAAGEMILQLLGGDEPENVSIPPSLVPRWSTRRV